MAELGIFCQEDYNRLVSLWTQKANRQNGGQEKIDALRQAITSYYYNFTRNSVKSGQYIPIVPTAIPNDLLMDNYMCIFPNRTLIETEAMSSLIELSGSNDGGFDMPPNDFYKQYFRYRKLIDKSISYLYPVRPPQEMNDGNTAIVDSSPIIRLKNVAEVSQVGQFEKIVQKADVFYLAFPWLYGADTDVF